MSEVIFGWVIPIVVMVLVVYVACLVARKATK